MSDSDHTNEEATTSHLEKVQPKDLVMFSKETRKIIAKTDYNFLGNDYNLNFEDENEKNIRVWGLPYVKVNDPVPLGVLSGTLVGYFVNRYRQRPFLSGLHIHLLTAVGVSIASKLAYDTLAKYKIERELVIWDYVKKNPKDFPEVFNPAKKYKDLFLSWNPSR